MELYLHSAICLHGVHRDGLACAILCVVTHVVTFLTSTLYEDGVARNKDHCAQLPLTVAVPVPKIGPRPLLPHSFQFTIH